MKKYYFANSAILFIFVNIAFIQLTAHAENSECGSLKITGGGPYDYRNQRDELSKVEGAHFTDVVEALIRGTSNIAPGGDIAFTLAVYPNSHRALLAMMRLGEREKTLKPAGSRYTVECWFDRAIRFRPDDSVVRMIYSNYLNGKGRREEANNQLNIASTYAKDSAITDYNIGLHYLKIENYDMALQQAHKAINLGWTQSNLKDLLKNLGKWSEPLVSQPLLLENNMIPKSNQE